MALVKMVMPKMGESVMEGTILNWLKKVGDRIEKDESVLEVATDKVDTEVPSTYSGVIKEILAQKGAVVQVGAPVLLIETESSETALVDHTPTPVIESKTQVVVEQKQEVKQSPVVVQAQVFNQNGNKSNGGKFYSPLVLNIARQEGLRLDELEDIVGTGKDNRVTKQDILNYLEAKKHISIPKDQNNKHQSIQYQVEDERNSDVSLKPATSFQGNFEIVEMDRMRKMIAERMLESKRTSPHVTSFVEADVTNIVYWRNRMKQDFMEREGVALTLTPVFIEAVVKAIKDYPMVNVSVEGDKIIVKKDINIGMAVALPNGNLIVPVIKNADQLNIIGLTKQVNDLARRARANKLTPDDLANGTYSVTNVGSFGNVMGTPIIMQPQCAILALGAVVKKPAVIETPQGDAIAIRHMMYLSHSYDHRVIDGSLGGMFVRRVADYLENFDLNRKVFN